jgi:hypothetical protein
MLLTFQEPTAVMGLFHRTPAISGRSATLSARLPLGQVAWASFEANREFALPYSIDRLAAGALEIATLGAVVALFLAALV